MLTVDTTDVWKQIPPEEKIELMSRAHSSGIMAAALMALVGATLAMALKISELLWAGLVLSPLVFQFAASKAWRDFRPRKMLEYLAARSAARRYAFSEGAKDLHLNLMFKGHLQQNFDRKDLNEALEAVAENNAESQVWVALFHDFIVMISECPGGAKLTFAHPINDRLSLKSSDDGAYAANKELTISTVSRFNEEVTKFTLTSRFPAALAVFEKRVLQFKKERAAITAGEEEDKIDSVSEEVAERDLFGAAQ